jgi:flagellar basal-body rod protein FlgB
MKIDLFGQHALALKLRSMRTEVLATNIANADTPNYKARDLDFSAAFERAQTARVEMTKTHAGHRNTADAAGGPGGAELKYRLPHQPSQDGNTVQPDVEQAEFAENVLRYRASLMFLDGKVRTLKLAIKGSE